MASRKPDVDGEGVAQLGHQVESLQARLEQIDREVGPPAEAEGSALRVELRALLRGALHALSRGELRRPAQVAKALDPLGWFVEKHLPDPELSRQELARELHATIGLLRVAADAADLPAFEADIKNRSLSPTHLGVLQTLLDAAQEDIGHLRCAEVRKRAGLEVSEQRIGQILRELHERKLALKTTWPGRGGELVPFYALTDAGVEVCQRAGLLHSPPPHASSPFRSIPPVLEQSTWPAEMPEPRRPIVAFTSTHGGSGTSLAAAHVATFLQRTATGERILAIDLDLESPDLARMLGTSSSRGASRGFYGLLLDYHHAQRGLRGPSLRAALHEASISITAPDSASTLSCLPAGQLTPSESEEARSLLRRETQRLCEGGRARGRASFLLELRRVLQGEFSVVLVDTPPTVRDPFPAYFGAVLLADALVSFIRPFSADVASVREVSQAFLLHDPLRRSRPPTSVLSVLTRVDTANEEDAVEWYQREVQLDLLSSAGVKKSRVSPSVRLHENSRASRGTLIEGLAAQQPPHSALFTAYDELARWVSTNTKYPYWDSLVKAVNVCLDTEAPEGERKIAEGMITNLKKDYMPQVTTLFTQRLVDQAEPALELATEVISKWTRRFAVHERETVSAAESPEAMTPRPGEVFTTFDSRPPPSMGQG